MIRISPNVEASEFQSLEPLAVIFDMDGVIIDSHPAHREAWRLFLRITGKAVSEQQLDFILDGHKRDDILRHFLGKLPEAELARYGRLKDEFFRRSSLEIKPVSGVLQYLQKLRLAGILMGLATSASADRTFSTLEQMSIRHYFSVVVTAGDVGQGKPDPAVYRLACKRLNIRSGNVFVFEDAVGGIQAAKAAGLRCAGVADPPRASELLAAGAEFVIDSFAGLSLGNLKKHASMDFSGHESIAP